MECIKFIVNKSVGRAEKLNHGCLILGFFPLEIGAWFHEKMRGRKQQQLEMGLSCVWILPSNSAQFPCLFSKLIPFKLCILHSNAAAFLTSDSTVLSYFYLTQQIQNKIQMFSKVRQKRNEMNWTIYFFVWFLFNLRHKLASDFLSTISALQRRPKVKVTSEYLENSQFRIQVFCVGVLPQTIIFLIRLSNIFTYLRYIFTKLTAGTGASPVRWTT